MELTPREDAVELARMHLEEDAVPLIRRVEAAISLWDGMDGVRVSTLKGTANTLVEHVAQQYRNYGWDVTVVRASDYNGPGLFLQ